MKRSVALRARSRRIHLFVFACTVHVNIQMNTNNNHVHPESRIRPSRVGVPKDPCDNSSGSFMKAIHIEVVTVVLV